MSLFITNHTRQRLNFSAHPIHPSLKPWVQSVWSITSGRNSAVNTEKFYPDGGASLTITFHAGGPKVTLECNRITLRREVANTHPTLSVRFHPGGIAALFDVTALTVRNDQIELGEDESPLWLPSLRQAVDTMSICALDDAALTLQRWLLNWARKTTTAPSQLAHTVRQATVPIEQLARNLGITRRTLERRVRNETGFSPLEITNIGRMYRARKLLFIEQTSVADIALQCGFYDQAHFTHTFKNFTFETPNQYRKRKLSQIYKN